MSYTKCPRSSMPSIHGPCRLHRRIRCPISRLPYGVRAMKSKQSNRFHLFPFAIVLPLCLAHLAYGRTLADPYYVRLLPPVQRPGPGFPTPQRRLQMYYMNRPWMEGAARILRQERRTHRYGARRVTVSRRAKIYPGLRHASSAQPFYRRSRK